MHNAQLREMCRFRFLMEKGKGMSATADQLHSWMMGKENEHLEFERG